MPPFITSPATCKFCGYHLELKVDTECPWFHVEKWNDISTCNRCAAYLRARRKFWDRIGSICSNLFTLRLTRTKDLLPEFVDKIQQRLVDLTRRLAHLTCNHYVLQDVWEQDFVNQLMDQPNKHAAILAAYERHVKQLAANPDPPSECRPTTNDP